jgi:hypothetical protein
MNENRGELPPKPPDLRRYFQGSHDLEELQRLVCAIQPLPELAALDLTEMTDYAVAVRYDFEFWPDQEMAGQAVTLAEKIYRMILDALPPECHP